MSWDGVWFSSFFYSRWLLLLTALAGKAEHLLLLTRRCLASGPARSLAQLGAGHLASPGHPSRRSAARCHRTRTPRHHLQPQASAPLSHVAAPGRPHPVTPAALHSCLFDTSPVTPPPGVLPPPQPTCFCARSRLQLPPPVPALLGTSGLRLEGFLAPGYMHLSKTAEEKSGC